MREWEPDRHARGFQSWNPLVYKLSQNRDNLMKILGIQLRPWKAQEICSTNKPAVMVLKPSLSRPRWFMRIRLFNRANINPFQKKTAYFRVSVSESHDVQCTVKVTRHVRERSSDFQEVKLTTKADLKITKMLK